MEPFARLEKILEISELSFPKLAVALGIKSPQTFYDIKKGKHGISPDLADRIVKLLPDVSKTWVMTGEGSMLKGAEPSALECRPHVPFEVFAGRMGGVAQSIMLADCEQRPIIPGLPAYDLTITVAGQSMSPAYESGDIIAIREISDPTIIRWGEVYVVSSSDGVAIKRVYRDGDHLRLVSYNPDYPDYRIPTEPGLRLYKVVALLRIC